ncbi:MAG TPA: aspartate-semialdehyde dehydrogenase [Myxococcota bacterium]|nr:aspartate-semialdehyde dehydrogenase [Myxococcota bacterium]
MPTPNDRKRTVAVVGATGAVGEVVLLLLAQRGFPVGELRALASERSAGTTVKFAGRAVPVQEAKPAAFDGVDFAFFAATGSLSKELAPEVAKRGGIAIDKSSTWRMDAQVPLVVPEINPDALEKHRGIVACPNCTTIGFVMALEPLRRVAGVKSVVVTTFQAVSGTGKPGMEELDRQLAETAAQQPPTARTYPVPIAHNILPLCESFRDDGYSTEEMKLFLETRKILGDERLDMSVTCARVPVRVGHSAAMLVETERPLAVDDARKALAAFPGVIVKDDPARNLFPTALDAAGRDEVFVGRVRKDLGSNKLWLWQVSDNLRKGAALNAIQIAEEMMRRGLK